MPICFAQSPRGTHTPEEAHMLLFPDFHHRQENCESLSSRREPVDVFTQVSTEPSSTRRQPRQTFQSCQNSSHYSSQEQRRLSRDTYWGHTGLMLQSRSNGDRAPCRGTAASELPLLHIRLKIQATLTMPFFCLHLLLCCGSMDPALPNSFQLIHLFHLL